jgi:CARDB
MAAGALPGGQLPARGTGLHAHPAGCDSERRTTHNARTARRTGVFQSQCVTRPVYLSLLPITTRSEPACQGGPAKRIYFEVHNRSSAAAPLSQVRIRFVNPQSNQVHVVNVPIQALAGQAHIAKKVTIPANCYSAGSNAQCNFTLTADPDALIGERFENNNVQSSYCVGPTF